MKQNMGHWIVAGVGLLAAGGLFLAGCEVDSASSTIYISPDSASLSEKEQSVELTCKGGYECTWSLATESWGTLNTRRGLSVVYTSHYQPAAGETPAVQIVTVASRFTSMSGLDSAATLAGATNTPSTNIQYATAYISHLPAKTTTAVTVTSLPEAAAAAP